MSWFIAIFTLLIAAYALASYYVYKQGKRAIPDHLLAQILYAICIVLIVGTYPLGRTLQYTQLHEWAWLLTYPGSIFLAFFFYCLLGFPLLQLSCLISGWIGKNLLAFQNFEENSKNYGPWTIWLVALSLTLFGFYNAHNPVIKQVRLKLTHPIGEFNKLRVAVISDIHLGSTYNLARTTRMVDQINQLKPDLVLFLGDTLDENASPRHLAAIAAPLRDIQAPLGKFAVKGNHEYISGVDRSVNFLEDHGIEVISDDYRFIKSSFYLVGRDDYSRERFTGRPREPLDAILGPPIYLKPVIVMDHQPVGWPEGVSNKVDLYLSGHTHDGQLWPLNFITRSLFGISYGYRKIDQTHLFVTCGYGTYGPPIRIGNRPEIVLFVLEYGH